VIDLDEVGAIPERDPAGNWSVRFGIYLPNITFDQGYRLKVRVIHELDQFIRGIEPQDFWMSWQGGSQLDRWYAQVPIAPGPAGNFGQPGRYLYRYQLLRGNDPVTFWFADPFGRAAGLGTLSAFAIDPAAQPFQWNDAGFQVPEVDDMVVYELNVREFNRDFQGVVTQLDYLWNLGVNTLELMPVTNVREDVEWGYTPLGYFAPDERLGGVQGMKQLVNACHQRGIAVILDAVYAHAHPEYAYNLVYESTGEPNPMMGQFAGEFFSRPGMDYRKQFTADYFYQVNQYWLGEYRVDGFRYDYVPGMYDGPMGPGYADLVYRTYSPRPGSPASRRPGAASSSSAPSTCPTPSGSSLRPTPTAAGRTDCWTGRATWHGGTTSTSASPTYSTRSLLATRPTTTIPRPATRSLSPPSSTSSHMTIGVSSTSCGRSWWSGPTGRQSRGWSGAR
jgi:Alpha amylase, catalytic domain